MASRTSLLTKVDALRRTPRKYKPLNITLLNDIVSASLFSGRIIYMEEIDSTNRYARGLCDEGAAEGTVVVAEYQRAGKGRMSRKWLAEPGANLLFSVVLRPRADIKWVFLLNCAASLATVEALEGQCGLRAAIKWPNDIYVGDKKLAGLLGEFSMAHGKLDWVILGIGLNVHWAPEQPEETLHQATSILRETGQHVCRTRLLAGILLSLEHNYQMLKSGGTGLILGSYKDKSIVLGREVQIIDQGETMRGKAIDIAADGSLIIIGPGGVRRSLKWGDVSVRMGKERLQGR